MEGQVEVEVGEGAPEDMATDRRRSVCLCQTLEHLGDILASTDKLLQGVKQHLEED